MILYPAIDLYEGKAVRLLKGDYAQMTVYENAPARLLSAFQAEGARAVHVVDLEGARDGSTPNLALIRKLKAGSPLLMEVGGGIRTMETIRVYLEDAGVDRVILGTAAVTDPSFAEQAVRRWGERIAGRQGGHPRLDGAVQPGRLLLLPQDGGNRRVHRHRHGHFPGRDAGGREPGAV